MDFLIASVLNSTRADVTRNSTKRTDGHWSRFSGGKHHRFYSVGLLSILINYLYRQGGMQTVLKGPP